MMNNRTWSGRLIFHIDADAFFASVEQACNPYLRGKPVIVCGRPMDKGVVTAASYEAKKRGIKAGMPVFEAKAIFPKGIYIPVDIPKYLDFSYKLLKIFLQYTRIVEPYSIDEAFLDLTGRTEPETIAAEIKKRVRAEVGITVSIGVAPNKLVAKVASDHQKPDGLYVVYPGEEATFLAPQPVKNCPGIGAKTAEALKSLNVDTFTDLVTIPEDKLRYMFGVNGSKLYLAARGIDDSPVVPIDQLPQEKSMGHETTFPEWIGSQDQLEGIIWELSSKIGFRLRERRLLAHGVRLKIKSESYGTPKRTYDKRFPCATADDREIARLAIHLFLKHWNKRAIKGIGVTVFALVSLETAGEQLALFSPDCLKGDLYTAIDLLKQKYGEEIIKRGTNLLMRGTNVEGGKAIGPNNDRNVRFFLR